MNFMATATTATTCNYLRLKMLEACFQICLRPWEYPGDQRKEHVRKRPEREEIRFVWQKSQISKKDKARPRDLQADANNGGSSAADDLDAVAEAAVEHRDREEGHDAPQQDKYLVFQVKK